MIDEEIIETIKQLNSTVELIDFDFFDEDNRRSYITKKDHHKVKLLFCNGQSFLISIETFDAFGDYKFRIIKHRH